MKGVIKPEIAYAEKHSRFSNILLSPTSFFKKKFEN